MIQFSDFKPGQEVFTSFWKDDFCYKRRRARKEIIEAVDCERGRIKLIGTGWFCVSPDNNCLIEQTLQSMFFKEHYYRKVFLSEEDCLKDAELPKLIKKIRGALAGEKVSRLSYEQLKQVDAIIEGSSVKET